MALDAAVRRRVNRMSWGRREDDPASPRGKTISRHGTTARHTGGGCVTRHFATRAHSHIAVTHILAHIPHIRIVHRHIHIESRPTFADTPHPPSTRVPASWPPGTWADDRMWHVLSVPMWAISPPGPGPVPVPVRAPRPPPGVSASRETRRAGEVSRLDKKFLKSLWRRKSLELTSIVKNTWGRVLAPGTT